MSPAMIEAISILFMSIGMNGDIASRIETEVLEERARFTCHFVYSAPITITIPCTFVFPQETTEPLLRDQILQELFACVVVGEKEVQRVEIRHQKGYTLFDLFTNEPLVSWAGRPFPTMSVTVPTLVTIPSTALAPAKKGVR